MSMVMIFMFAMIILNMTTKELRADKESIMERADAAQAQAAETGKMLNNLLERTTGQRLFNDEAAKREEFYNSTKT